VNIGETSANTRVKHDGPYAQQLDELHHQWASAELDAQLLRYRDAGANRRAEILSRRYNTLLSMSITKMVQTTRREIKL